MTEKRKSLSLEECIKKSRVEVEIDEKMITIERKRYHEIKDGSEPNIGDYAKNQLNNDQQLDYEAKFWKGKCEKLLDERNNLEKQLLNKLGAVLQKYEKLRDYSKQLEKNCSEDSSNNTDPSCLRVEIETAMEKIHVYETLTSMKITGENDHICTITNPAERIGSVFTINFQNQSDTIPTTDSTGTIKVVPKANTRYLPPYLQDGEIICEQSSAPYLLKDILQNLFGGDHDNSNNSNTTCSTASNNTSNVHNSIETTSGTTDNTTKEYTGSMEHTGTEIDQQARNT